MLIWCLVLVLVSSVDCCRPSEQKNMRFRIVSHIMHPSCKNQQKFQIIARTFPAKMASVNALQGVQGQTFMFQFTLRDRNMQVRFGLKVFWES